MCFRSRILCVVFSFIVALLGLLPIRLLRLIVTTFLGKFWSATAVDAVCSHLVKVKVCLVIDWWSWLPRSYNIFRKVINLTFSCACYFLLSRSFYQCFTDLTILPLSNRMFFVSECVCTCAHLFWIFSINISFVYLQYHTMRNVLFMAMTEFRKVKLLLFVNWRC